MSPMLSYPATPVRVQGCFSAVRTRKVDAAAASVVDSAATLVDNIPYGLMPVIARQYSRHKKIAPL